MRALLGVVAGLACATVIACSAGHKAAMAPSNAAPAERPQPMPSDPRAQIQVLSDQIDQERQKIGLPETVLPMSTQPPAATPRVAQDQQCHPATTSACGDVCKLSDSICDNSDKICKISDDLGDDEWAAGKCASSRQTCGDSHKRCCECS